MKKLIFSILLIMATSVSCSSVDISFPSVSYFRGEPSSISPGESATLSWDVSGATRVNIDHGVGDVALTGEWTVTPTVTTIYTITARNPLGVSATATAQVLVSEAPDTTSPTGAPVVNSFAADTYSIPTGGSAVLSWNVSNATTVTIDQGVGTVSLVGTITVSPATSTNYTLTASNAAGSATRTVTITLSSVSFSVDLRITTGIPIVTPSKVMAGGTVGLSPWTIKNEGAAETGLFSNGFYLSADPIITSDDTYLFEDNNENLTAGGQFNWGGPTLTIPPDTTPGSYYIGILVDWNNVIAESNENNNYVSSPITVTTPLPLHDLLITTGSPILTSTTVMAGETIGLSPWTVKYEGTTETGPFSNGYYLSTDSVIWPTDTYLGGNTNPSLSAGSQRNWESTILTIPPGTPPGSYYIGILVDRNNVMVESNENNNYVSTPITVTTSTTLPDLVITTGSPIINPSTVYAGGTVGLSAWTVKNEGAAETGPFSNGYYLSSDLVITSEDTYLYEDTNENLAAGAQFSWSGPTLTIPPGTPQGNYYIGMLVDRNNVVVESNESNNYVVTVVTVN